MSRPSAVIFCVLVLSALLPDCVDTSALDYVPTTLDAGSGTPPACVECVTGQSGPCWTDFQHCLDLEICTNVMQCLIDKGCIALPAADRVTCGLPCATEHGLVSATDPSIAVLSDLNICALTNCPIECSPP